MGFLEQVSIYNEDWNNSSGYLDITPMYDLEQVSIYNEDWNEPQRYLE